MRYGILEGRPVVWSNDGWEAWELGSDAIWREVNGADVVTKAEVLHDHERYRLGPLPPLPERAFQTGL